MARQPRFFVPNVPLHVTQRGNNRGNIFVSSKDYRIFLDCLCEASHANGVLVHAYVLMTNHVHLLATPSDTHGLPRLLQSVGRRYVQHFNRSYSRTGTLWEGRYRAAVVDSERYFLTCMRYIELNPVRAGFVHDPSEFTWSSHAHHVGRAIDPLINDHPVYWALGNTPFERQAAYRHLFDHGPSEDELAAIRRSTQGGWLLGAADAVDRLAPSRRLVALKAGRPRRRQ